MTKNIYKLSKKIPVLSQILKDSGYYTFLYTENPYLTKEAGLFRGFDYPFLNWELFYKDNYLDKIDRWIKALLKSGFWFSFWHKFKTFLERIYKFLNWKRWIRDRYVNPLKKIDSNLQKILLNSKNQPFFLFFNLMINHAPYLPSQNILKSLDLSIDDFKTIKSLLLFPLENYIKINLNSKRLSEKKIHILNKLYDTSVLYSDWIIKQIFQKFKELGMLENTFIIITSDHGELLGSPDDHYYWTHGVFHSVYEPLIRVPLIIYNSDFKSKKVKKQVELKDLFHTILHLTGIPEKKNDYLDITKSLIHQIDTNSTPKYIFGEFLKDKVEMLDRLNYHRRQLDENLIQKLLNDIYFLRSDNYKLIKYGNKIYELYDILNDPNEKINLINIKRKEFEELKLILQTHINNMRNKEKLTNLINKNEKNLIKKAITNISFK